MAKQPSLFDVQHSLFDEPEEVQKPNLPDESPARTEIPVKRFGLIWGAPAEPAGTPKHKVPGFSKGDRVTLRRREYTVHSIVPARASWEITLTDDTVGIAGPFWGPYNIVEVDGRWLHGFEEIRLGPLKDDRALLRSPGSEAETRKRVRSLQVELAALPVDGPEYMDALQTMSSAMRGGSAG